jgi:L-amino acid N-acyltransferase YncA
MQQASFTIRPTTGLDLEQIQAIYAREVETGTASFELVAPDLAEITRRYNSVLDSNYDHFVAAEADKILGYAYTSSYRARPGYRFSVENSVYVRADARGKGIASELLQSLINTARQKNFHQMIAVIGDSENHPSIRLHEKHGFAHVGTIRDVGFKFDRWLDSVIMQRRLSS